MMTYSEAILQIYVALAICAVVFSIVVILTVWIVGRGSGEDDSDAE